MSTIHSKYSRNVDDDLSMMMIIKVVENKRVEEVGTALDTKITSSCFLRIAENTTQLCTDLPRGVTVEWLGKGSTDKVSC